MIKFDKDEVTAIKSCVYVGAIALAALFLMIWLTGCSSMSIAKQKKAAMLLGQQIEFIGEETLKRCNDNTLKDDNCNLMADLINFALDSQNAYARALISMQEGTGSQDQVQKALEALQNDMAALISNAIGLGIRIRQ